MPRPDGQYEIRRAAGVETLWEPGRPDPTPIPRRRRTNRSAPLGPDFVLWSDGSHKHAELLGGKRRRKPHPHAIPRYPASIGCAAPGRLTCRHEESSKPVRPRVPPSPVWYLHKPATERVIEAADLDGLPVRCQAHAASRSMRPDFIRSGVKVALLPPQPIRRGLGTAFTSDYVTAARAAQLIYDQRSILRQPQHREHLHEVRR
jgi:hypothetical protein